MLCSGTQQSSSNNGKIIKSSRNHLPLHPLTLQSQSVRISHNSSTQQRPQTLVGSSCLETDGNSNGQQISHLWKPKVHDYVHNLLHPTHSHIHPAPVHTPHYSEIYSILPSTITTPTLQFWSKILYLFLNSLRLITNFPSTFRNTIVLLY